MPGLMDMHVHFGGEYQSKAEAPLKVEREMEAILATQHAVVTFKSGFTTVRQVGDSGLVAISLRDAINAGKVVGPRIFAAGKTIATTGGHADPTNGKALYDYSYPVPEQGVVNGPYEVYAAVRQRYKDGADGIKITVTGGVLSQAKSGDNPQFTQEEVETDVLPPIFTRSSLTVRCNMPPLFESCFAIKSFLFSSSDQYGASSVCAEPVTGSSSIP